MLECVMPPTPCVVGLFRPVSRYVYTYCHNALSSPCLGTSVEGGIEWRKREKFIERTFRISSERHAGPALMYNNRWNNKTDIANVEDSFIIYRN